MDPTTQRLLQGAAGASGDNLYVDDVFSTYVYKGNGTAQGTVQQIVNGIDNTEGGLVWIKNRYQNINHMLLDTERVDGNGDTYELFSNTTNAQGGPYAGYNITAFNNNGFKLEGNGGNTNDNTREYVAWNFRKAKGFFDIVTYTGSGSTQNISHGLGSVPGLILIKNLTDDFHWAVYHQSVGNQKIVLLNDSQAAATSVNYWNDTSPTATHFTVNSSSSTNANNKSYVAYIFAHDDQSFGEGGDQSIVKCGGFTTDSSNGYTLDLGWEPQFLMYKRYDSSGGWFMLDTLRGWSSNGVIESLRADQNNSESGGSGYEKVMGPKVRFQGYGNGYDFLYLAIRKVDGGCGRPIEDGTKVFAMDTGAGIGSIPNFDSGFPVDMQFYKNLDGYADFYLSGKIFFKDYVRTNHDTYKYALSSLKFDWNLGHNTNSSAGSTYQSWMWKNHAGFDISVYEGTGSATTFPHSLGKTVEMLWIKGTGVGTGSMQSLTWQVFHKDITNTKKMELASAAGESNSNITWNPTASTFNVGTSGSQNKSGDQFLAMAFASVEGVSKVGSFSGSTGTTTLNLGFDCRFLLIKSYSASGDWLIFDTLRGMAGAPNQGEAEFTTGGAHTWTCPSGVTSVSVVCVGAGGTAGDTGNTVNNGGKWNGGGGGGLGYKNNISVSAGTTYNLNVGTALGYTEVEDTAKTASWFINDTTVKGGGGRRNGLANGRCNRPAGGDYVGDGGGNGGEGGADFQGSGGGAGGYSGNGGKGADNQRSSHCGGATGPGNGSGGGGGGGKGPDNANNIAGAGGGGVGIYGQGSNGAGGASAGAGGGGGSNGGDGNSVSGVYGASNAAAKYGGGGAASGSGGVGTGAGGAVRIVWSTDGTTRAFPSTNVASAKDEALELNDNDPAEYITQGDFFYKTSTTVVLAANQTRVNANGTSYIYYAHA